MPDIQVKNKLPFQLLVTTTFNQFEKLSAEEWKNQIKSSFRQNNALGSSDNK
jgi:hypothetical protein